MFFHKQVRQVRLRSIMVANELVRRYVSSLGIDAKKVMRQITHTLRLRRRTKLR